MLVRSKNNSDEKDYLAIGQKEYSEINPFGYKDYKESYDKDGWWKTVEYTDENGEKVEKSINPLGQVIIKKYITFRENVNEKQEISLDESLLEDFDDDNQLKTKTEQHYDCEDTPEPESDEKILSEIDFYRMDWKETQYTIYRLLVNIASSLSYVKDVPKENGKQSK